MSRPERVAELWRARKRSRFLALSVGLLCGLAAWAWLGGGLRAGELFSGARLANVRRFATREILPPELRDGAFSWSGLLDWAGALFADRGLEATGTTLAISVLAIVLASAFSFFAAPLAARNVATAHPFLGADRNPRSGHSLRWRALRFVASATFILMRALPEYLLAFLLLAVLGPLTAWPAVLALAIHNAGILARLNAEVIENLDPAPMASLRALGARRNTTLVATVFPLAVGRSLLFFFYRFETCVREATVLGMLGIVSLGYWIQDARAKLYYDEMLLFVLLGSVLIFVADLLSAAARRFVRG